MDENKNMNQPSAAKPTVAKIAKSNPRPESDSAETNIFAAVYSNQKKGADTAAVTEEKNVTTAEETAEAATVTAVAEKEDKTPAAPVAAPKAEAASVKQTKNGADKAKIRNTIVIVLAVITVVVLVASLAFLLLGNKDNTSAGSDSSIEETVTERNTVINSPFTFEHVYSGAYPEGMQDKYKMLYDQNNKIAGWVTVPGTSIDFPVYKYSDNAYYIRNDNYNVYNKYGTPFLDMYSNIKNLSKNTVVYAHNFGNGLIFDELHNYTNPQFVIENPVIEYNSIYQDYKWKVIGAFYTNGDGSGDNGYLFYYIATTMGNNSFMEFYDEIQQRSIIHTGVDVQPTDKILTLTTCTYFFDRGGKLENARFAVVARLMREGESEEIDPSLVKLNENVRYPQLYYDVFGGTNPYANASRWTARND